VFGFIGLLSGLLGGLLLAYLGYVRLVVGDPIGDRPLLLLAVLMVLIGVQFLAMGLLGELMMRTYYETQRKPIYVVRDEISQD